MLSATNHINMMRSSWAHSNNCVSNSCAKNALGLVRHLTSVRINVARFFITARIFLLDEADWGGWLSEGPTIHVGASVVEKCTSRVSGVC